MAGLAQTADVLRIKPEVRLVAQLDDVMQLVRRGGAALLSAVRAQRMVGQVCQPEARPEVIISAGRWGAAIAVIGANAGGAIAVRWNVDGWARRHRGGAYAGPAKVTSRKDGTNNAFALPNVKLSVRFDIGSASFAPT